MRRVSVALIAGVLESTVYTPYSIYIYMLCKWPQMIKSHPFCCGPASLQQNPTGIGIFLFHLSPKVKVWLLCAFFSLVLFCSWTLAGSLLLDAARPWAVCILYTNGWIHHSSRSSQGLLKLLGSSTQLLKVKTYKTYCLPLSALKAVDAFKQVSEAVAEVRIWSLQQLAETRSGRGLLWLWVFSFYAQARRKALTAECLCRCIL